MSVGAVDTADKGSAGAVEGGAGALPKPKPKPEPQAAKASQGPAQPGGQRPGASSEKASQGGQGASEAAGGGGSTPASGAFEAQVAGSSQGDVASATASTIPVFGTELSAYEGPAFAEPDSAGGWRNFRAGMVMAAKTNEFGKMLTGSEYEARLEADVRMNEAVDGVDDSSNAYEMGAGLYDVAQKGSAMVASVAGMVLAAPGAVAGSVLGAFTHPGVQALGVTMAAGKTVEGVQEGDTRGVVNGLFELATMAKLPPFLRNNTGFQRLAMNAQAHNSQADVGRTILQSRTDDVLRWIDEGLSGVDDVAGLKGTFVDQALRQRLAAAVKAGGDYEASAAQKALGKLDEMMNVPMKSAAVADETGDMAGNAAKAGDTMAPAGGDAPPLELAQTLGLEAPGAAGPLAGSVNTTPTQLEDLPGLGGIIKTLGLNGQSSGIISYRPHHIASVTHVPAITMMLGGGEVPPASSPRFISQDSLFHPDASAFNQEMEVWAGMVANQIQQGGERAQLPSLFAAIEQKAQAFAPQFGERFANNYGVERIEGARYTKLTDPVFREYVPDTFAYLARDTDATIYIDGKILTDKQKLPEILEAGDYQKILHVYSYETRQGAQFPFNITSIEPVASSNTAQTEFPFTMTTFYPRDKEQIALVKEDLSQLWDEILDTPPETNDFSDKLGEFIYTYSRLNWHIHGESDVIQTLVAGLMDAKGTPMPPLRQDVTFSEKAFQMTLPEFQKALGEGYFSETPSGHKSDLQMSGSPNDITSLSHYPDITSTSVPTDLSLMLGGGEVPPAGPTLEEIEQQITQINPFGMSDNCTHCTLAVDQLLAGKGLSEALPDTALRNEINRLQQSYTRTDNPSLLTAFMPLSSANPVRTLFETLAQGASNARGIVDLMFRNGTHHTFNIATIEGQVTLLDGQTGRIMPLSRQTATLGKLGEFIQDQLFDVFQIERPVDPLNSLQGQASLEDIMNNNLLDISWMETTNTRYTPPVGDPPFHAGLAGSRIVNKISNEHYLAHYSKDISSILSRISRNDGTFYLGQGHTPANRFEFERLEQAEQYTSFKVSQGDYAVMVKIPKEGSLWTIRPQKQKELIESLSAAPAIQDYLRNNNMEMPVPIYADDKVLVEPYYNPARTVSRETQYDMKEGLRPLFNRKLDETSGFLSPYVLNMNDDNIIVGDNGRFILTNPIDDATGSVFTSY
jgi:hypothetical protein